VTGDKGQGELATKAGEATKPVFTYFMAVKLNFQHPT
jgi:hypothetical protein